MPEESPGKLKKKKKGPRALSRRESNLIGQGLGLGSFKSFPDDCNMQPCLRVLSRASQTLTCICQAMLMTLVYGPHFWAATSNITSSMYCYN